MDLSQYSTEQLKQMAGLSQPKTDLSSYSTEDLLKMAGIERPKRQSLTPEQRAEMSFDLKKEFGTINDDGSTKGGWINSDWIRKPAAALHGSLNSSLNPVGFMAKGLNYSFGNGGWEIPKSIDAFEPETKTEKAISGAADAATGLAGTFSLGAGLAKAGLLGAGKRLPSKIGLALLNPENQGRLIYAASQGRALADYVDPESGLARFGLEMFGSSPVQTTKLGLKGLGALARKSGTLARKGMALVSGVSDDALQKAYEIGKDASIAENNINYLTAGQKNSILGKTKTYLSGGFNEKAHNLLENEAERLARQTNKELAIREANGYTRRGSGTGDGNGSSWVPRKETVNSYSKIGIETPEFIELPKGEASAKQFYNAISTAKSAKKALGATVDLHPVDEYKNMRLFLTKDGKTGFAINPNNGDDIISVFNNGKKGLGEVAVDVATSAGGKKLDAYDTFLPELYSRHGFKPTKRFTWNEQYRPADWNKGKLRSFNYGEPDVVMMKYDPTYTGGYSSPNSLTNNVNKELNKLNAQKIFKSNLKGETSIGKVVDDATDAYRQIQKEASAQYQPLKEKLFRDPTKLDLTDINNTTKKMVSDLYDRGVLIGDEKTAGYIGKIADAVKRHSSHPDIKGFDSMRRSVEAIEIPLENKVARRAQKMVADSIKDAIVKQNPEYKKLLGDYSGAMDTMKEIKNALHIGGQNRSTTARSMMQAVRDGVNANFGTKANALNMLEKASGTPIGAALVGQELGNYLPRGLQRGVGAAYGLYSGLSPSSAGLLFMSPRINANIVNAAGRVVGKLPTINVNADNLKRAVGAVGLSEIIKNSKKKGDK